MRDKYPADFNRTSVRKYLEFKRKFIFVLVSNQRFRIGILNAQNRIPPQPFLWHVHGGYSGSSYASFANWIDFDILLHKVLQKSAIKVNKNIKNNFDEIIIIIIFKGVCISQFGSCNITLFYYT